ncbi:MAG: four helix bundle protein [Gemmatimonadaceae bacterium]
MGDFRKLIAWQEADSLASDLYAVFTVRRRNAFPGLRRQILKAAGSTADCLVECCAKLSPLDFRRYAEMAYASSKEVEGQLIRAKNTKTITPAQYTHFAVRADRVSKLCYGLTGQ